ncbi:transposable element Tcb1 transposase [Trichonephila clavipes]|nr:transposable element Tcb1 transposase [Trichonephila clavipes]
MNYGKEPPTKKNILSHYHQFEETSCLCKKKSISEEAEETVRQSIFRSPEKPTRVTICELGMLQKMLAIVNTSPRRKHANNMKFTTCISGDPICKWHLSATPRYGRITSLEHQRGGGMLEQRRLALCAAIQWSCTGYYGIGRYGYHSPHSLVRIAGTFKQPALHLRGVGASCPSYPLQGLATAIFQQDNERTYVARIVQRFFINHRIELFPRPARSPDLSPIENMWSMLLND